MKERLNKAGRIWEGKLNNIIVFINYLYEDLSKTDKHRYDAVTNSYYRYYNDGDFPRILASQVNKNSKAMIEKLLEQKIEDFLKKILSEHCNTEKRKLIRKKRKIDTLRTIESTYTQEDVHSFLYYRNKVRIPNERFYDLCTVLERMYTELKKKVEEEINPDYNHYSLQRMRELMKKENCWNLENEFAWMKIFKIFGWLITFVKIEIEISQLENEFFN